MFGKTALILVHVRVTADDTYRLQFFVLNECPDPRTVRPRGHDHELSNCTYNLHKQSYIVNC